jgi:hypothetical protein
MLSGSRFSSYGARPSYPFHGGQFGRPSFWDVPPIIFERRGASLAPARVLHAAALVASSLRDPVALLGSLQPLNVCPPTLSNLSVSLLGFSVSPQGVPPFHGGVQGIVPPLHWGIPHAPPALVVVPNAPVVIPAAAPAVAPAVVPAAVPTVAATMPALATTVPAVVVPGAVPPAAVPALFPAVALPSVTIQAKLLKLDPIKDAKAFLDSLEQIQFHLCMHQKPSLCQS